MRMRLTTDGERRCIIAYDDYYTQERLVRSFFAPPAGGYVREDGRDNRQVCDRLEMCGSTLMWYPSDRWPTLASRIRSEYRDMRRHEKASEFTD